MGTSIVDYNSLSAGIANWMTRAGNADLLDNVPDFIAFAEARINYGSEDPEFPSPPLRVSKMELNATAQIANNSNAVGLPSDFLEMRRLYVTGNPNQKLTYVTPNQMDSTLMLAPPGPQVFYTLQGGQVILAAPVQTSTSIVMGYYQAIPALSTSNTVNWLLAAHPGLYLAGGCLEGNLFIGGDDSESAKWARIFSGHVRAFQKQDLKGRYSGDALQIKTDVGNP